MPQFQAAALTRHEEEEVTDKTKQAQIKQPYEKHLALSSPSEVMYKAKKDWKTQEQNNTRQDLKLIDS